MLVCVLFHAMLLDSADISDAGILDTTRNSRTLSTSRSSFYEYH